MTIHYKLLALIALTMSISSSFLWAVLPETPENVKIDRSAIDYHGGAVKSNPHLNVLELRNSSGGLIALNPAFSADPSAPGEYSCSIEDYHSTVNLSLTAADDSQVYIDGGRVSSNGESTLRIAPTDPINGPSNIIYTIRVENAQGHKDYVLNIEREVNPRLRFGRQVANPPHLASATGDVFGMNSAPVKNKFTIQAWVRWTGDPATADPWTNIATQNHNSDRGQFWLQHSQLNTNFEFAFHTNRELNPRVHTRSTTVPQIGVWYLVTGVYDGAAIRIFVNGTQESSAALTGDFNPVVEGGTQPALFNVGKMPYSTRRFPGNVRNLRIWVGEARTASQIADDYTDTPLAGSGADTSNFSWPMNETAVGSIANGNGSLDLSMMNVISGDFVAWGTHNFTPGKAMVHRPARMDLSSVDSQSVILVQADGYSGSDLRFRILGHEGVTGNEMQVWDHVNNSWIGSGAISSGVLMDAELGDPATGTYFWVPVRRNTSTLGAGRYVDDDMETGYNGNDTDPGTRTEYNTIMPLPSITAMNSPFTLAGSLMGSAQYPLGKKYVILGYDAVEKGKLITATSSSLVTGDYALFSDVSLYRIEVRTQDDVLITELKSNEGWSSSTNMGDTTLPVELSSFSVSAFSQGARLHWVSQSESNLLGYYVYRSERDDYSIAQMVSSLIEATNSSQSQVYTFFDMEILTQTSYYYWLLAMEYSGESSLFGPIHFILSDNDYSPEIPVKTGLDKLYPNPFNPTLSIRYGLKEAADVTLTIFNVKGQKVHSLELPWQNKGYHQYLWDATAESSGIYFVTFASGKLKEMRKITLSK